MKAVVEQLDEITIEYVLAPNMVVFSHGFGVRRDTAGFFTEIAHQLPAGFGYVLFDYNQYDAETNTVQLSDFTDQIAKLKKILDWTRRQKNVQQVSVIAHSMGAIVVALAKPQGIKSLIMLAPPTSIGENTRSYFTGRPGASEKNGVWSVPRTDGTTSKIPVRMFDEFEATDAGAEIINYSRQQELTIITAAEDEVLRDTDYENLTLVPNIKILAVAGANHNFTDQARPKIISIIKEHL